jgi:hypothetical protein
MGCIKKVLSIAEFSNYPAPRLEMELNENGGVGHEVVHLQTALWRIELTEPEFKEFATTVCEAGIKLRDIKLQAGKDAKPT